MEMLSEHQCEGWLEGYLLTGRHGLFNCYEAFIHIVDSMFNQHAKWLKVTRTCPGGGPIASLNYLLTSHVWRRTTTASRTRTPASSTTSSTRRPRSSASTCRRTPTACCRSPTTACAAGTTSTSSSPASSALPQWLTMDEAVVHCTEGIGIWEWASNDQGASPDVVMACCGDVPTLETLAAVSILREHLPELKIRVVNVVDLMKLQPRHRAPARPERRRLRRPVHHRTSRSSSPSTATPG
jgi:xylulose-5-phosphate/fructose-6-phosphate phosphoketolase